MQERAHTHMQERDINWVDEIAQQGNLLSDVYQKLFRDISQLLFWHRFGTILNPIVDLFCTHIGLKKTPREAKNYSNLTLTIATEHHH